MGLISSFFNALLAKRLRSEYGNAIAQTLDTTSSAKMVARCEQEIPPAQKLVADVERKLSRISQAGLILRKQINQATNDNKPLLAAKLTGDLKLIDDAYVQAVADLSCAREELEIAQQFLAEATQLYEENVETARNIRKEWDMAEANFAKAKAIR